MTGNIGTCGVCGRELTADALTPPTVRLEPVPGRPGVVRPVLSKAVRIDPDTGAVCWCDRSGDAVNRRAE